MRNRWTFTGLLLLAMSILYGCADHRGRMDATPSTVEISGPDLAYPDDSVSFTFTVTNGTNPVRLFEICFEDAGHVDTSLPELRPRTFSLPHCFYETGSYFVTARIGDGMSEPQIATHEITIGARLDPPPDLRIQVQSASVRALLPCTLMVDTYPGPYGMVDSTFTFAGEGNGYIFYAGFDTTLYYMSRWLYRVSYTFRHSGENLVWASVCDSRGVPGRDTLRLVVGE
ncbi:MAG TPA: hypothetical protein VGL38_13060 [bacterium]|jgi:hypothetical protein